MLEQIEWTNIWREHCDEKRPRVLVVGDSIMNGSQCLIGKALGEKLCLSCLTTSKAIDDPWYQAELDLLLRQEESCYQAVYFNNGLHTGGLMPEIYGEHYRKMVLHLQKTLPGIPVILGLSTPIGAAEKAEDGSMRMTADPRNETVLQFNRQVQQIGDELGLQVFDAYGVMEGHPEWRCPDCYHYYTEGYQTLAVQIALVFKKALCLE